MTVFHVTIAIGDPAGQRFEELEALPDTGATWTWVPRDLLERLGHQPTFKRRMMTADNRSVERDGTEVAIRIGGETFHTICIFGDVGSRPLLGMTTLEQFSLAPDPVNERLVPVAGLLMSLLE